MRELLRNHSYWFIMVFCLAVLYYGMTSPYPIEKVAIGLQVLMIFVILGLEFVIPYQQRWGDIRKLTRADAIYFLAAAPIDTLQIFLIIGLLASTTQYHQFIQVVDFWPSGWPILVQLFIATLFVDFFKYWYHRWTHEVPLLWRFHSIHHCLDRLEMLRASYFYPFDIFITQATGTLTMLMLGVDYEIIVYHNTFAGITGLLNHSNVDLRCGWLDVILNSPGHHRAHHSVGDPGRDSNYGSFFNFADRMFGTRYLPEDQSDFGRLGLDDDYDMPPTVLKQLLVPFRWKSVHREV